MLSGVSFSTADIIARLNWIAEQSSETRQRLREDCEETGHIPTGEQILTTHPQDCCYHCGVLYYADPAKGPKPQ